MTDKYKALRSFTTGKVPRIHWLSEEGAPCAVPLVEVQQELKALIAERDALAEQVERPVIGLEQQELHDAKPR